LPYLIDQRVADCFAVTLIRKIDIATEAGSNLVEHLIEGRVRAT